MQGLPSELLELSRVGRIVNPPEEMDLGRLTQEAVESVAVPPPHQKYYRQNPT